MLIINKRTLNEVKQRILQPESREETINTLKQMRQIKEALLWRADAGTCCASGGINLAVMLSREVDLLDNAIKALEKGNQAQALSWLDDYIFFLENNYVSCESDYCQS